METNHEGTSSINSPSGWDASPPPPPPAFFSGRPENLSVPSHIIAGVKRGSVKVHKDTTQEPEPLVSETAH